MESRWLNASLDVVTPKTLPTLGSRLLLGVMAALMAGFCLGWPLASAWLAADALAETWTWFASRPQRRRQSQSNRQRLWYLGSIVWMNCVWAALAVLFWESGDPALRLCAAGLLACQMLHASIFNAQSNALLAIVGGIPAATLIGLSTLATSGLGPFGRLIGLTAIMMVAYVAQSAFVNRRNAQALEASEAAAVAANRAKSDFLALMSHELRTPMTGVMGMAQALADQPLTAEQRRQVEVLIRSGHTLLGLLNDILDLSKIESGKLELEQAPFDPADSVRTAHELWRGVADAKGLAFEWGVETEDGLWAIGDEVRFRQIVGNLIGNALKFTETGGVKVTLRCRRIGADRAELRLVVADTGIGMSEAQAARLFRPFGQADASVTRRFGGTGLGLSICRQLVVAMGGDISVSSAPGLGSTFTVSLALPAAAPAAATEAEAPARGADEAGLQGLKVLFVDDNAVNRLVGATLLQPFGCEVDTAEDGVAALERLARTTPDVLLLDIHMPRLGGEETLQAIRGQNLLPPGVPVIALTADVLPDQVKRLLALGFDGVEAKPMNTERLVGLIASLCEGADRAAEEGSPRCAGVG